jgi:PST family polysaccharide transporter
LGHHFKKKRNYKELKKTIKIIFPIVFIISLAIFFLREFIVLILYTEEFLPMIDLFFWQMMGNVVKITAWLFGYILVAKAMVKYTTLSEVFLAITFVLMTFFLVKKYGVIEATYSYLINSFFYLIMMAYIYKFKVKDE